ncbi:hypothetical protein ACSBR1_015772 [Camellia fascicularis]
MQRNRELTREAMKESGSFDLNLKAFVEEIGVGGGDCSSSVIVSISNTVLLDTFISQGIPDFLFVE